MPKINQDFRKKLLQYDKKCMEILSSQCPEIQFKVLDDEETPELYEVSYYLKTIISEKYGKPIYQNGDIPTIIFFDFSKPFYPCGGLHLKVKSQVPYHPNWYENGILSHGDMRWLGVIERIIFVAKIIQFQPQVTAQYDVCNRNAKVFWEKNKYREIFPCDDTKIPSVEEIETLMPKIKIRRS